LQRFAPPASLTRARLRSRWRTILSGPVPGKRSTVQWFSAPRVRSHQSFRFLMRPSSRRTHVLVAVLAILGSSVARGQGTPGVQRLAASDTISTQVDPVTSGVVLVSGDSVDQLRIAELMGTASTEGLMLRSTSSLTDPRRHGITPRLFTIVMPHFYYVDNSNLPFGQNDGALWAGAGANARVLGQERAGVRHK